MDEETIKRETARSVLLRVRKETAALDDGTLEEIAEDFGVVL